MTLRNKHIASLITTLLVSYHIYGQQKVAIPRDTSAVQLTSNQVIKDNGRLLSIEKKSYVVSEFTFNKLADYEGALKNVQTVLRNAVVKLENTKSIIYNLESKLNSADNIVNRDISVSLEKLKSLELELASSREKIGSTNTKLEGVEKDLKKTSKKLKKRKTAEKAIRVVIGGLGLAVGVLIGGVLF